MMSRQSQKGGDNSTNIQAENMVMQLGIDEKRAREVFQEMNLQLRKEYTQEALEIANSRVSEFENSLMPKMEQVDGALEAFADPSFQLLVIEAQKTAASTERTADYDLLSELLVHRFQKGENRIARAGISLAVGIVDKVADDALLGLTVAHAVNSFFPVTGNITQGLDVLNDLFGKILYGELPVGQEWLDHLDILSAVRLNSFGSLKKIQQYYPEILSGYTDVGIEKNSDSYTKAIEILNSNQLPLDLLTDHSFNAGFQRLIVSNRRQIESITLHQRVLHEGQLVLVPVELTKEQIKAINSVYDLYSQDGTLKQKNIESFMAEWDKRQSLMVLKEWWDNIPTLLTITSAGKVLAHSNAQRCDNKLPPLN
ncbi:LPO_1073/Vpar_1526 family protein [uncultured Psychrosphaera sp.]|uniref:LPO_1073/Vpar_1526 family protein n=1 Tax=uncultured Psychrosphaera sp. TaxID=1403522 RepID=UPI0026275776|nr:LPO_1073/Vpar_1526 family protein [uncultured Psychrosphaera sp.]